MRKLTKEMNTYCGRKLPILSSAALINNTHIDQGKRYKGLKAPLHSSIFVLAMGVHPSHLSSDSLYLPFGRCCIIVSMRFFFPSESDSQMTSMLIPLLLMTC